MILSSEGESIRDDPGRRSTVNDTVAGIDVPRQWLMYEYPNFLAQSMRIIRRTVPARCARALSCAMKAQCALIGSWVKLAIFPYFPRRSSTIGCRALTWGITMIGDRKLHLDDIQRRVAKAVRYGARSTGRYVEDHPWALLAIATSAARGALKREGVPYLTHR